MLLYLTVLFDISPQPFPVMVLLPPIVSALLDGPSPKIHRSFGILDFGDGCRGYVDSGQTKHFCQVRWLLLANNGTNGSAVAESSKSWQRSSRSICTVCVVPVGGEVHWEPG